MSSILAGYKIILFSNIKQLLELIRRLKEMNADIIDGKYLSYGSRNMAIATIELYIQAQRNRSDG